MKQIFAAFLLAVSALPALAQEQVNDPNAEKRNVTAFHAIQVSNAFDVYLTQGNEDAVAVSASSQEFRDKIITTVENGVLKVRIEDKKFWRNTNKMKLKAYISFRDIDRLNVSGACEVKIIGTVKADKLDIHFSGASDMNGRLEVGELSVHLSGASDLQVNGTAGRLKVDVSGASDFKGFELAADYCEAEASGASSVKITVNKELSAKASGASDVGYKGTGLIRDIKTSGASNISKRS